MDFATIACSSEFHSTIKQIAALKGKKMKMYEVIEEFLPAAKAKLEQLQKQQANKGKHHARRTTKT